MSLYKEIVDYLEAQILANVYSKGTMLPSETTLCQLFHTSRMTVRKALDVLCARGMIHKIRGKGSFVSEYSTHREYTLGGFAKIMAQRGVAFQTKVLINKVVKGDAVLAQQLKQSENAPLFQLKRMRSIFDKPICVENIYLCPERFPQLQTFNFETVSLYETLQKEYGVAIKRIEQQISTVLLTGTDAKLLFGEKKGTALFIRSISYDEQMQPVDLEIGYYNGFRYTIDTVVQ